MKRDISSQTINAERFSATTRSYLASLNRMEFMELVLFDVYRQRLLALQCRKEVLDVQ